MSDKHTAPVPDRATMIQRMKAAIEGECDGLAVDDKHAAAILDYVIASAPSAPAVPDAVLKAVERMSNPLHDSRLTGVTAQEDARCMKVISDFIKSLAAVPSVSADAKDAERYRWLRGQHWNESTLFVVAGDRSVVRLGTDCPSGERLDAAIDDAIAKSSP